MKQLVLCGALAFLLTAAIIVSLNLLSARVDHSAVTASIRTTLQSGAAEFPASWQWDRKTGIDTWTDCLVLSIATYPETDLTSALARANHVARPADEHHNCEHLENKLGGGSLAQNQQAQVDDYWRYWWGSAALLNVAMGIGGLTLPQYQTALKVATYLAILLVLCTAFIRYRRAAWPFLPLSAALAFGFAIPLFGQSIANAPGLVIGLLFLSVYMAAGIDRVGMRWQFVYLFVAGGVGCYFAINGDPIAIVLCFAFIRLLSICAFGPPRIQRPAMLALRPTTTAVAHAIAAYVTGAVSMEVFRIVLHAALTGQRLFAVLPEWRAELSKYSTANWNNADIWARTYVDPSLVEIFRRCYYNIGVATFPYIGRLVTLLVYGLCGLIYTTVAGLIFLKRRQLRSAEWDKLAAAFLTASIIPVWYCAFAIHTIIHFFMMGRLLSVFFALAPGIALMMLSNTPRRSINRST